MKQGKKVLSVLLVVVLLVGCLPLSVGAAQPELSAQSNSADPFSLQQELYFKDTHIATINLPQDWKGRVVTKTNDGYAPNYFPSITCYSRLCTEKREEKGNSYCGDGKLFTIEITSGDSWKNMPCKWVSSFQIGGTRYEVILLRVTDDRFNSADPAIQAEGRFFQGDQGEYVHDYNQEVIDNIVFHVETGDGTQGGDTGDDDLTIPYELRTGMGDVILTMRFPERWRNVLSTVDFSNDPSSKLYWFNWTFEDSNQAELFTIELCNLGGSWSEVLGNVTLYPERPGYTVICEKPSRSPYADHDTSAAAVAYMKMRKDIPAILDSIEPNPALKWGWFLGKGFADVLESAYYYDAVKWAVDNGITSGVDKAFFRPNSGCTRGQAVTFLWRAAGEPEPQNSKTAFTDVKTGDYYEKAVRWAVEKGITSGTSATRFSPGATCTRAQIVTFLWRAQGSPAASGNSFSDVKAGEYYESAVSWAVGQEITAGTSAGKFSPGSNCTRGQIVTFLYRYSN